jgi:CRP/FNR family transcriptional regulator, cyclic AMP receptor protein
MKGETISFAPGQLVFREGDPCDGVYFIQEGKIEIFRERDGLAVSFGFQSAGEVLGTLSMFTREARAASAKAISQVSLLHVNAETLDLGIKSIPVWALALLKDTVNRLKIVDERLVESKLLEKKLKARVGTNLQHAGQMAAFLGALMRLGSVDDDGILLFPLNGFVNRCEGVLQRRAEYLQYIFDCFVNSGLLKVVENKKYGLCVSKPKFALLEDFGVFCNLAHKSEFKEFAPAKLYAFMSALGRAVKKKGEKEAYSLEEMIAGLNEEMGRTVGDDVFAQLQLYGVLRPDGKGLFVFKAAQCSRRIVFEGTCRMVKEVEQGF